MPAEKRYTVTAPNGRTYTVYGPPGASDDQVIGALLHYNPEAGTARQAAPRRDAEFERGRQATARTRAVPNILRRLGDVADVVGGPPARIVTDLLGIGPSDERMDATSAFTQGVTGLGGAVASAVDADSGATQMFNRMGERARGRRSDPGLAAEAAGAQRRDDAEGTGLLNEMGAGFRSVFDDPIGSIGSGAGSLVAAVPAAVGAYFGGIPAAIGVGATTALGVAAGAGGVKKSIFDSVQSELVGAGVDEETAREIANEAQAYGGENTGSIALGAILGLIASRTGIEGPAMRVIGQKLANKLGVELAERTAARGMVSNVARGAAAEGVTEGAQGGQERLASNLALRNEGFDTPVWEGVAGQAAMEGTIGAILGGGVNAVSDAVAGQSQARRAENAAEDARLVENTASPYETEVTRLQDTYNTPREEAEETAKVLGFAPPAPPTETGNAGANDGSAGVAGVEDNGGPTSGAPGGAAPAAGGGVAPVGPTAGVAVPAQGDVNAPLAEPVVRPRGKKAEAVAAEPVAEVPVVEPAPPQLPGTIAQTIYDMAESKMPDMGSEQNAAALTGLRQSLGMEPRFAPEVIATFQPDVLQAYRAGEAAGNQGASVYTDFLAREEAAPAATPKAKKAKVADAPVPDAAAAPETLPQPAPAPAAAAPVDFSLPSVLKAARVEAAATVRPPMLPAYMQGVNESLGQKPVSAPAAVKKKPDEWQNAYSAGWKYGRAARQGEIAAEVSAPPVQAAVEAVSAPEVLPSAPPEVAPTDTPTLKTGSSWEVSLPKRDKPPLTNGPYDLGKDTPKLYREMSMQRAELLLPRGSAEDLVHTTGDLGFSDTPDLALGQGENRGVTIEFDAAGIKGRPKMTKPTALLGYREGTGSEYTARFNNASTYRQRARSVRVANDATATRATKERLLRVFRRLEEDGWVKTKGDGFVQYDRPDVAPAPAPPVAPEVAPTPAPDVAPTAEELLAKVDAYEASPDSDPAVANMLRNTIAQGNVQPAELAGFVDKKLTPVQPAQPAIEELGKGERSGKLSAADRVTRRQALTGLGAAVLASGAPRPARATTTETLADAVKTGDANKVLEWLASNATSKEFRALAALMVDSGGVGATTINTTSNDRGSRGTFDPETGTISMRPDEAASQDTLLHELLHAFVGARYNTLSTALAANRELYGMAPAQAQAAIDELNDIWTKVSGALETNPEFAPFIGSPIGLSNADATVEAQQMWSNPDEFFAWALTDPDAKALLQSMDVDGKPFPRDGTPTPHKPSMWDKLVDWVRKLLGMKPEARTMLDVVLSRADTVLRHAKLDKPDYAAAEARVAYRSGRGAPLQAANKPKKPTASATPPAATPTPAAEKAKAAAKKGDSDVRKLQLSTKGFKGKPSGEVADLLSGAIDARSVSNYLPALKDALPNLSVPTTQGLLKVMPTSGIVDWVKDKIPALERVEVQAQLRAGQLQAYLDGFGKISQTMLKFINKHGNATISNALHLARMKRVDVDMFGDTLEASYAADPIIKHINSLLNNKKKSLAPGTRRWLTGEATKRKNDIRVVHEVWTALGKQKGGQDIYRQQMRFYRDMFAAMRAANDAFIRNMGLAPKTEAKLLKVAREPADSGVGGSELIPDDLYPQVYVPFRRYGKHWLRIAAKVGSNDREFYMFESAGERDAKLRDRAETLGLDLNDPDTSAVIDTGDSMAELQKKTHAESALLKTMFDAIDSVIADGAGTVDAKELEALKDRLFQTYLMSQPERSIRKSFIHTDNVTGMDPDIIRTFNNSAIQFATQLTNGKFRAKMRRTLEEARASIVGATVKERARYKLFIDEMEARVESDFGEVLDNAIVNFVNRASFVYFLTGAGTAIVQWTAIPIRVMPKLTTDYGYAKATAMLIKYMALPASVGMTTSNPDGSTSWIMPTFGDSSITRNRKVLARAFKALKARAAFETAADAILNIDATPKGIENTVGQITRGSANIMGAAFQASERMSREMIALMAFELEYNKTKDFEASVDKAVKVANDTLGNYLEIERPPLAKGHIARSIFMFKQYSLTQTRFFIGAAYAIQRGIRDGLSSKLSKAERKAALRDVRKATHELAGVTLMAAMFAGIPGLFLYPQMVMAVEFLLNLFGDDEDKEDARSENPFMNPYDDLDGWFWQVFMRRNFGEPTVEGTDGRLHSFASMLEYGPVSELTDANVGSRTSFADLWFREGAPAETSEEFITNMVVANIPPASMILNMPKAYDDFRNGHVMRGLTTFAPAFFGGPMRAYLLDKQGIETRKGDSVVDREFFTESNIWAQRLGLASTAAADVQADRFAYLRAQTAAARSMSAATERLYRAATDDRRGENDIENAYRIIDRHNKRYPNGQFTITDETLERSFKSRANADERTYGGILVNEKDIPYYNAVFGYGYE